VVLILEQRQISELVGLPDHVLGHHWELDHFVHQNLLSRGAAVQIQFEESKFSQTFRNKRVFEFIHVR